MARTTRIELAANLLDRQAPSPAGSVRVELVGPEGVEPSTLGLRGRCAADCATIPAKIGTCGNSCGGASASPITGGQPRARSEYPSGYALLSRQARQPRRLCCPVNCPANWRSAEESNPLPLGIHPGFQDRWPTIQPERSRGNLAGRTWAGKIWYARRDSNPHCRRSERRASCRLGYARVGARIWCSGRDSNPHWTASRTASSAALGYPSQYGRQTGAAPGSRTRTEHGLSVLPLPIGPEPRIGRPIQCCPGFFGLRDRRLS
jgi:hypothetical protein